MRISCPLCGARDLREFVYRGPATLVDRPAPEAGPAAFDAYLHGRDNPAGPLAELWLHEAGCRAWLRVVRDTRTHAILETGLARDAAPGGGRDSAPDGARDVAAPATHRPTREGAQDAVQDAAQSGAQDRARAPAPGGAQAEAQGHEGDAAQDRAADVAHGHAQDGAA